MKLFLICIFSLLSFLPPSFASVPCGQKFDGLEELRVSSFDEAVNAPTREACFAVAQKFLDTAGTAPEKCVGAKALIKDWSDSYQSDTGKKLSTDPATAFSSIKDWAYQTLKTKCKKRQF
jgi:hypothetical protein